MERMQLAIGRLLLIGVVLSFLIVLVGGIGYLWDNSNHLVDYQHFNGVQPSFRSISAIMNGALGFTPLALIQFGILFLVLVQLLRVALVGWFFIEQRDEVFIAISAFVLLVLIYSLLSHF